MFSPFCILAFYRHCVGITFSDTVFSDAYFACALQISSPLYTKHFAHAMNYPTGNARDTHHMPVLTCWCNTWQTDFAQPARILLFAENRLKTLCVCVCVCISFKGKRFFITLCNQLSLGMKEKHLLTLLDVKTFSCCVRPIMRRLASHTKWKCCTVVWELSAF